MSIRKDLAGGVLWTSVSKYAGVAVTLVVSAILSRIFGPEQFGVVNIATVLIAFFSVFSDMGIGPAVIQKKDLSEDDLKGIFSLTGYIGLVLSALLCLVSPLAVRFYSSGSELGHVIRILAVCLFFNSLNMVPNALIMKEKRFKFAGVRSFVVQLVCGSLAVASAYAGLGIYALTVNPVLSSIILFFINWKQHPMGMRPKPGMECIRKVFSFSLWQFLFQLINYFSRNLDKLLMGRYMDMTQLGYYDRSYRLMMLPLQNLTYVIAPVLHPVYAQIQEDKERICSSYLKVLKLLAVVGFPLSAALFFMAEDLVLFFSGDGWGASVPAFKILALSVGFQLLSSSSGSIFQALNATKTMFFCGVFTMVTSVSAICIGIFGFGTTVAVATCVCTAFLVNFIQCFHAMFCICLKEGWWKFWKGLTVPVAASLLLGGILYSEGLLCAGISFPDGTWGHFLRLCLPGATTLVFIGGLVYFCSRRMKSGN